MVTEKKNLKKKLLFKHFHRLFVSRLSQIANSAYDISLLLHCSLSFSYTTFCIDSFATIFIDNRLLCQSMHYYLNRIRLMYHHFGEKCERMRSALTTSTTFIDVVAIELEFVLRATVIRTMTFSNFNKDVIGSYVRLWTQFGQLSNGMTKMVYGSFNTRANEQMVMAVRSFDHVFSCVFDE